MTGPSPHLMNNACILMNKACILMNNACILMNNACVLMINALLTRHFEFGGGGVDRRSEAAGGLAEVHPSILSRGVVETKSGVCSIDQHLHTERSKCVDHVHHSHTHHSHTHHSPFTAHTHTHTHTHTRTHTRTHVHTRMHALPCCI